MSEREVLRLVRHEMAATVEDVIFRRTILAMQGRLSQALLERIAVIVAEGTGRSTAVRDAALTVLTDRLVTANAVSGLIHSKPAFSGGPLAK